MKAYNRKKMLIFSTQKNVQHPGTFIQHTFEINFLQKSLDCIMLKGGKNRKNLRTWFFFSLTRDFWEKKKIIKIKKEMHGKINTQKNLSFFLKEEGIFLITVC